MTRGAREAAGGARGRDTPDIVFVVAGALDQHTGGYLYDARMVEGLRQLGRRVRVVELPGEWPSSGAGALEAFAGSLSACDDGTVVVVDGLVGGAAPGPIEAEAGRLRIIALVHHPLADEGAGDRVGEAGRQLRVREGRTLTAVRGVIVTSDFTAERVVGMGADPTGTRVVEPGTERAPDTTAADTAAPDGPVGLLCVGSVVPRKDQAGLVRALERLHASAPELDWKCSIVGSLERAADYASTLVAATAFSPVSERVEFAGEVDDAELDRRWRAADVFVSASRYEGYGMALTEAMIRGLPVVAMEGGAVRCTVPPDVGLLVTRGTGGVPGPGRTDVDPVDALALALRRVVSDPARRAAMARRSREHAESLPGWDTQATAFDAAVRELAHG